MNGPEHLEADRRPLRRRSAWLVGGVALVVVGGLAVVRLTGSGPAPAPAPTASRIVRTSSTAGAGAARHGWPTGLGLAQGTLYVLADDGLHTVDVTGGLVEQATLDLGPGREELTSLASGVLLWSPTGGRARVLPYAGAEAVRPSGPLRSAAAVLPGPDGKAWAAVGDRGSAVGRTWVPADETGATGPGVRVTGTAVGDGSGGLLGVSRRSVRHVVPGPARDVGPGTLLAVGSDGYVVNRCVAGTCTALLHERSGDRITPVRVAASPNPQRPASGTDPAALSPGNSFLAETFTTDLGDQVRVSRVGPSPDVLRNFPGGRRGTSLLWLTDRWLVATSAGGLALYDAEDDTLLTPTLPFTEPSRLAFRPA